MVTSGKNVKAIHPQFDAICRIPGRGVSVSGIAPTESGFDFYSRFFTPKIGVNEVITENYDYNIHPILVQFFFLPLIWNEYEGR